MSDTPPGRGRLIVIETPHGAYGTELTQLVTKELTTDSTIETVCTGQPTHTPLGSLIRHHHARLRGTALALTMAADTTEHVEAEIAPRLTAGKNVVCHGYVASSMVTNARTGNMPMKNTWLYHRHLPEPDLTVYIDEAPEVLQRRLHWPNYPSEDLGSHDPRHDLALFDQARHLLHEHGWRNQHRLDCRNRRLSSTARHIAALVYPHAALSHHDRHQPPRVDATTITQQQNP